MAETLLALKLFADPLRIAVGPVVDANAAVAAVHNLNKVVLPVDRLGEEHLALAVLAYVEEDHVVECLGHYEVGRSQD